MRARPSLRRRVALTLAAFSGVVGLALAGLIYVASHDLERRLIDETLTAELDDLIARRGRNPDSLPERTATIRAFVVDPSAGTALVPPVVDALAPGRHEITLAGIPYRAAVRPVGAQHFVVLFDVSALRRRERIFALVLGAAVVLTTAVSALAGWWLASRVIAPVTGLARRVAALRPEDAPPPLADEFPWSEVHALAADVDGYLARLHAFMERERQFTGDISHELRTPLAVITGAVELLQADPRLNEQQRVRVARIARAVDEMSEMAAALLALAREQGSGRAQASGCEVAAVAAELIERYRGLVGAKPVTLELDVCARPTLPVDRAVLSMVLGNLVRNALSFTAAGQVLVRVEDRAVAVSDTGPGIGAQVGADVFQPYVRSHDSQGVGLGLSLVRRLCVRQAWTIALAERPGGGTVARLHFNVAAP